MNLSEFQMKLLENIEELTLYAVRHEKENQALKSENAALGARVAALEQALIWIAKDETDSDQWAPADASKCTRYPNADPNGGGAGVAGRTSGP